ncbi:hypothetical protein ABPG75_001284 [Micractinium tetrahymenae]
MLATPLHSLSAKEGGARMGRRRRAGMHPAGRGLLVLLALGLIGMVMHLGPVYPAAIVHLHLHLPQLGQLGSGPAGEHGHAAAVRMVLEADGSSSSLVADSSGGTLSFDLCGGFAAQRAALVSGLALAAELNRTLVLPRLLVDGGQRRVPFSQLHDADAFAAALLAQGLPSTAEPPAPADTAAVRLDRRYDYMSVLVGAAAGRRHVRVDCPLAKVPPDLVAKHEGLVLAALGALQPVARLQEVVARWAAGQAAHSAGMLALRSAANHVAHPTQFPASPPPCPAPLARLSARCRAQQRLQGLSGAEAYSVLHLRAERDWVQHCAEWEGTADGTVRDNCLNNTASVGDQLVLHNVDKQLPLLLLAGAGEADAELLQGALSNLQSHNFQLARWEEAVGEDGPALTPDEAALVGYSLALGARQFAGNSVSVFSALLVLQRWRADAFATYYNGGNIPLEALLPLYPMPWVFTYNDWSAGTEYEYMVRAAVTSAIEAAHMKPYCMYSGSEASPMHKWFVKKGVRIIRHDPAWKEALIKEGRRHRDKYSELYSHLYRTDGALVGAFQRIDIPILSEFDQYNYVLFTDCDVFFRKRMRLLDWGTPLPAAIGMGFERFETFPYNDGVMLWNMPYMRLTNAAFVAWILNQTNGLYFPGYGPVDQGAFNQYYEGQVKGRPISKNLNSMIYHDFRPDALIIHLHGPKPNHYGHFVRTGACPQFNDLCEIGFSNGLCQYVAEYARFSPGWPVVQTLLKMCKDGRAAAAAREAVQKRAAMEAMWRRAAAPAPVPQPGEGGWHMAGHGTGGEGLQPIGGPSSEQ